MSELEKSFKDIQSDNLFLQVQQSQETCSRSLTMLEAELRVKVKSLGLFHFS